LLLSAAHPVEYKALRYQLSQRDSDTSRWLFASQSITVSPTWCKSRAVVHVENISLAAKGNTSQQRVFYSAPQWLNTFQSTCRCENGKRRTWHYLSSDRNIREKKKIFLQMQRKRNITEIFMCLFQIFCACVFLCSTKYK